MVLSVYSTILAYSTDFDYTMIVHHGIIKLDWIWLGIHVMSPF